MKSTKVMVLRAIRRFLCAPPLKVALSNNEASFSSFFFFFSQLQYHFYLNAKRVRQPGQFLLLKVKLMAAGTELFHESAVLINRGNKM